MTPLRRKLRVIEVRDFAPVSVLTLFWTDSLGPLAVAVKLLTASLTAHLSE
jgi:hypothetical protein